MHPQVGGLKHKPHQQLGQLVDAKISDRVARRLGVDIDSIPSAAKYNSWGSKFKGAWHNFAYSVKRQFKIIGRTFYNMATRPFTALRMNVRAAGGLRNFLSPRRIINNMRVGITTR